MTHIKILETIFDHLKRMAVNGEIPISLRTASVVGTVQDDPFDSWVGQELVSALPGLEVVHAGKLTTPDLVIRDKSTGIVFGLEVKKLIQKSNGGDSRGLTLDYNSCLPCGKTIVSIGNTDVEVPNFYLFCLLNQQSTGIVSLILMDGDFLNYKIELHTWSKTANITEYNHGPYGEGSIRHRNMYTYPNPMNSKIDCFHLKYSLVIKEHEAKALHIDHKARLRIRRDDIYGNNFMYLVLDNDTSTTLTQLPLKTDIFAACKRRIAKNRTPSKVKLV